MKPKDFNRCASEDWTLLICIRHGLNISKYSFLCSLCRFHFYLRAYAPQPARGPTKRAGLSRGGFLAWWRLSAVVAGGTVVSLDEVILGRLLAHFGNYVDPSSSKPAQNHVANDPKNRSRQWCVRRTRGLRGAQNSHFLAPFWTHPA